MKKLLTLILATTLTVPAAWSANHQPADAATSGEVRKIDKENGKITLKHGEIRNLGMPGMTMVFQVKDPAVLDRFKVGDQVTFTAEKADGGYAVTTIDAAK
jgi:Cu/Ag efflux protein CusF